MTNKITKKLEEYCKDNNIKITEQRRIIAEAIAESDDHPDVDQVFLRAKKYDNKISIATTYRTMKLLEEASIIEKHDFGNGKSRYELVSDDHHDHLIDIHTGEIIEFHDESLENLKSKIAEELGYKLVDHRLELYATSLDKKEKKHG
ncbi:MAG: transcriptional repressor [Alphaproteobacteria bacterium]|jgi:Fur family transcriptional regulator, ferric uptake regulator|nr:transcriptional repressor [Alphaproteobacteria bacterium]MBT5828383.1 transcriptional repressor [Alphaproteobacteria bacterium]